MSSRFCSCLCSSSGLLRNSSASAAILPSALFGERLFARCQLGVLVSAGAATCESTLAPIFSTGVGPGLGRSHLNSAVELDSSNPTLGHGAYHFVVVPQWLIDFPAHPQLVQQHGQLPSDRNHRSFLGIAFLRARPVSIPSAADRCPVQTAPECSARLAPSAFAGSGLLPC